MAVINDNYDQLKIDKLKYYLEAQAGKGQPVPFEIFVDNLRVVARSEEPKDFDSYEYYMNEDTEKVRILIYSYGMSPRNDQYCFMVQKNVGGKSLNGLTEMENAYQEKLAARDREHELNRLREQLEAVKEELEDSEEYTEQLEKQIEDLKENRYKMGGMHFGELASVAVETLLRRNTQFLTKLPGGEVLAGIIEQDNRDRAKQIQQPTAPEPAVSFQKKEAPEQSFTEAEVRQLHFLNELQQHFDQKQIEVFNIMLGRLAADPSKLQDIATLFKINY